MNSLLTDEAKREMKPYSDITIRGVATSCGNMPIDAPLFSPIVGEIIWTGGSVAEWDLPMTPYFRNILNLFPWGVYDVPDGVNYKSIRMLDASHIGAGFLDEALTWLDDAVRHHEGPILVHCQAGINRSNLVVAAFLVTRLGWEPRDTIDHIREQRCAAALCNPAFEGYIMGLGSDANVN
jgi:hypothetical protein